MNNNPNNSDNTEISNSQQDSSIYEDIDDIEMNGVRNIISNECKHIHSDWTSDIEELIKRWKDQTEKLAHIHQESGYINKTRYYRLAIPSILLPFIMTLVSQNLYTGTNDTSHIIDGAMFMTSSILSALTLFFNYSQISEEHFQISSRYTDISNRIDSELARKRKFRTPSDVFITELKSRIENLGESSPPLPGNWC